MLQLVQPCAFCTHAIGGSGCWTWAVQGIAYHMEPLLTEHASGLIVQPCCFEGRGTRRLAPPSGMWALTQAPSGLA